MYTFEIYKNGNLIASLENQTNDINLIGKMHKIQSSSLHWAVKYEGYKIISIDENTKEREQLKATNNLYLSWVKI